MNINTLVDVTQIFVLEQLETVDDLRAWLFEPQNIQRLKEIKVIGSKTAGYFKILTRVRLFSTDCFSP